MQIANLTKDCSREDCRVSCSGQSTTLMGWTQSYDKKGKPIGRDPNTTTAHYRCSTCGVAWKVQERDGEKPAITTYQALPKVSD